MISEWFITKEEMLNFIKLVRRNPNTLLLPDSETLQKVDKWIRIVDEKRKGSKLEIVNTDLQTLAIFTFDEIFVKIDEIFVKIDEIFVKTDEMSNLVNFQWKNLVNFDEISNLVNFDEIFVTKIK